MPSKFKGTFAVALQAHICNVCISQHICFSPTSYPTHWYSHFIRAMVAKKLRSIHGSKWSLHQESSVLDGGNLHALQKGMHISPPALYWHAEPRRFAMRCSWTEESEELEEKIQQIRLYRAIGPTNAYSYSTSSRLYCHISCSLAQAEPGA